MTEQFQPGDVVQLKSGSPLMTVDEVKDQQGKPQVFCSWFEKTKRQTGSFHPTSLKKTNGRRGAIAIQF